MKSSLTFHVLLSGLLAAFCVSENASAQTSVLFPLAQMTGTTNDTTITVRPINNPVNFHSQIYWLPPAGIQLRTTNGSATTNLIPNDYTVTIAGVPGSWRISVNDTNVTLNAAEIGNLTTYTFTNSLPGVFQLIAGANISLSPPNGKGVVTVSATGGGGGGTATNSYQIQAGNNLITIATNQADFIYTISGVSQTNAYPWGVLYDAVGTARSVTNGYPWGILYDAAGAAQSATNGYPWGILYDAAGSATAATNGLSLASGLAAFRGTNTFASTNVATASLAGLVKVDNSTIVVASDGTISATTGGGGTVTSVALSVPNEFSVSGSPVTGSGTLSITRTGDANFLGFNATNIGNIKITNGASIGGQATISGLILTNGFTNQALTASSLLASDSNKKLTSVANGIGALTNDGAGNFGYASLLDASALKGSQYVKTDSATNLVSTLDGGSLTNTITWSNPANTNIAVVFNGTIQSYTLTNQPKDVWFTFSGANGSASFRCPTNTTLHLPYPVVWLSGTSNSVVTNGVFDVTSYGGTNYGQLVTAIGEGQ
ncbi:MAG TPA: hypothetical protein VN761_03860 [Candidatus Polarisedimenticolia bacterium]|nr:hypothetical protein [Candidatus Polarisedimenticolia bacterium]